MKHLHPSIIPYLDDSLEERIRLVNSEKWIGYPVAKDLLETMEDIMNYPVRSRPKCLLVVGYTNNGKTAILQKFSSMHPVYNSEDDGEYVQIPVLSVQMPPAADERQLLEQILQRMGIPFYRSSKVGEMLQMAVGYMKFCGVKMLMLDELQHILASSPAKRRGVLNTIKFLSNELKLPVILAGTEESARAVSSDRQIENRFPMYDLPRWKMDKDLLQLLRSFEALLPLREPSNLADKVMAGRILSMGENLIGEMASLIALAATYALKSGEEHISMKTLDSLKWTYPSERNRRAMSRI